MIAVRTLAKDTVQKRRFLTQALLLLPMAAAAQGLTLDSCKRLALSNNRRLAAATVKAEAAGYARKSARTAYLPKVEAVGAYSLSSRSVSLLSQDRKNSLGSIGASLSGGIGKALEQTLAQAVAQGAVAPQSAKQLGTLLAAVAGPLEKMGNGIGAEIADAFDTDTRQLWMGTVQIVQPIYMGGAVTAANSMADIGVEMAANSAEAERSQVGLSVEQAYWAVVSLEHKRRLAESYCGLLGKLCSDVGKMLAEGVATKADSMSVGVKKQEADFTLSQAEDGVKLAKMLLCQLCGLPIGQDISLQYGNAETMSAYGTAAVDMEFNPSLRPEYRLLQNMVDMSRQATKMVRAAYMPQVALTGGFTISNPSVFNGFERKFGGVWGVGVGVRIPVWNWLDGTYKVRAGEAATAIAGLELEEARSKMELQVAQCRLKLTEAAKRLDVAKKAVASAEENMRAADIGFREGVMEAADVMAAQTAWLGAKSREIDAEIEVKLSCASLNKALGLNQ